MKKYGNRAPRRAGRSAATFRKTPLAATIASLLSGGAALAQTPAPDADKNEGMGEITVTATRREASVLDIPYNISAMSGDELEARNIIDTVDLMRAIPGVAVVDRGYRNSGVVNGIMIRGVNVDGAAFGDYALSTVPTVSTYVNDTPIFANFILRDIERVEVLRGPQGTLYGSGSLGGTVRYITRSPQLGEWEGRASATLSDVDGSNSQGWSADLALNVPLGEQVAFRINGGKLDYPGLTDYPNVYQLDANGVPVAPMGVLAPDAVYEQHADSDTVDIWYGRAQILWQPGDAFRMSLSGQMQSDEIGGRRQMTVGEDGFGRTYDKYENGSIQLEPSEREVTLGALELELDLGFATLTSSSSYYQHDGDSVSENTGFYAQAGFLAFYYNYPRPMASAVRTYLDRAFVQELRLVSRAEGALDYVFGLYYQDQDLDSTQVSYLRGFKRWWDAAFPAFAGAVTGDIDFDYARNQNFTDRAAYGELTWHVSNAFSLTGGLRYFDNDFVNDTFMALPLYTDVFPPTTANFETSEDDVLFKANAGWNFDEQNMLYATVSEGYRRGGANAVPTTGTFAENPGFLRYDSDSVTNYELGIKGSSNTFRYAVAAFLVDWENVQVNTATPTWGFFAAINGGKASAQGLEAEIGGALGDHITYSLGYTYVDAQIDEDIVAPGGSPALPLAVDGAALPGTAENTINLAADYTMQFNNGWSWTNRVTGYYQSATRNAISNTDVFNVELASFQLWGLSTAVGSENWDASLWVRNLFNEEGVTGLFTEAYMGTAPAIGYFGNGSKQFISLPRTVGLTLNYRF